MQSKITLIGVTSSELLFRSISVIIWNKIAYFSKWVWWSAASFLSGVRGRAPDLGTEPRSTDF